MKDDIAGTWVATTPSRADREPWTSVTEYFLILRSDGSWNTWARTDGKWGHWSPTNVWFTYSTGDSTGKWSLAGDTLWFDRPGQLRTTRGKDWQLNTPYSVAVEKGQLVLTPKSIEYGLTSAKVVGDDTCQKQVFTRFDTLKLPPAPTPKPAALALDPTAFVGTWEMKMPKMKYHRATVDTITIRADSTWDLKHSDWSHVPRTGTWRLLPGSDMLPGDQIRLVLPLLKGEGQGDGYDLYLYGPVTLRGNQFTVPRDCTETYVYNRISP